MPDPVEHSVFAAPIETSAALTEHRHPSLLTSAPGFPLAPLSPTHTMRPPGTPSLNANAWLFLPSPTPPTRTFSGSSEPKPSGFAGAGARSAPPPLRTPLKRPCTRVLGPRAATPIATVSHPVCRRRHGTAAPPPHRPGPTPRTPTTHLCPTAAPPTHRCQPSLKRPTHRRTRAGLPAENPGGDHHRPPGLRPVVPHVDPATSRTEPPVPFGPTRPLNAGASARPTPLAGLGLLDSPLPSAPLTDTDLPTVRLPTARLVSTVPPRPSHPHGAHCQPCRWSRPPPFAPPRTTPKAPDAHTPTTASTPHPLALNPPPDTDCRPPLTAPLAHPSPWTSPRQHPSRTPSRTTRISGPRLAPDHPGSAASPANSTPCTLPLLHSKHVLRPRSAPGQAPDRPAASARRSEPFSRNVRSLSARSPALFPPVCTRSRTSPEQAAAPPRSTDLRPRTDHRPTTVFLQHHARTPAHNSLSASFSTLVEIEFVY